MRIKVINLRKLWLSLLLLVGATAIAIPGIQEIAEGNVAKIGSNEYATLQEAYEAAQDGDVITLLDDIDATKFAKVATYYNFTINKSITLDGDGHSIKTDSRGIAVNQGGTSTINVTFKNLTVNNATSAGRAISTRGNIGKVVLDNVKINCTGGGNTQGLTVGGNQSTPQEIEIINGSEIHIGNAGYCIITFNPVTMDIKQSKLDGWASIYARRADNSAGSNGSVFTLDNCEVVSTNVYTSDTNYFAALMIEDDNVTISAKNTQFSIISTGNQYQALASKGVVNLEGGNAVTLDGDKSILVYSGTTLNITGGTYNFDPSAYLADGFKAVENNGTWTVQEKTYVAKIGSTKYETLADAVAAASEGDVITMIDDDNLSLTAAGSEITINKPLTITGAVDENGKPKFTIYGSANGALSNSSFNDLFISCSTGTVTISNLKFDGFGNEISSVMGHSPVFIGSSNNNAVIENVYISNLNCEGIHINGGTFTIKDCNIDCSKTTNSIFTKGICVVNAATGSIENTTITGVDCNDANDTSAAIELQGSGDIAISGCTIESETIGIATTPVGELTAGTSQVTVSDCTVTSHNIAVYSNGDKGALTSISSGQYSGLLMAGDNDEGLSISGGIFDDMPEPAYCAENYIPTDNTDEATKEAYPYTVKVGQYVAEINGTMYETLQEAWENVQDGETITLIADCSGNGIKAPQGKFTNGVTIDFDGHTYTMDGDMVGSSGTETQAFQLLKDNKITFKNGTIYSEKAKMLVQNYSDLTLEGMTLALNNANYTEAYTLSNNNGNVVIDGTTINANPAGGFAFDVCRYASYPSVSVIVKSTSEINGDIQVDAGSGDPKDGMFLTVEGGTINGDLILTDGGASAITNNAEKAVVKKNNDVTLAAPQDYKWVDNGDGTSTLAPCVYVAQIGDDKYESLAASVAAVPADGTETTITMIANETIDVNIGATIASTQKVVLDLNGFTISQTAPDAKTSALIRNNGTLTIKDNSDINADGTGTGKLYSEATQPSSSYGYATNLISNYGQLTIESGYLESHSRYASYVVDNYDNGNAVINGGHLYNYFTSAVRQFCNSTTAENNVTVNGGIVEGYCTMWMQSANSKDNKGSLTINGGTFKTTEKAVVNGEKTIAEGDSYLYMYPSNANMSLTITGGEFDTNIATWGDGTIEISGGTFNGWIYSETQEGFITGGYFIDEEAAELDDAYVADGYICVPATDKPGYYIVKQGSFICAIGTTKYETLADAVAAAGTAETTITLLTEAATDGVISGDGVVVPTGSNITFDLNGLTYDVSGETVGSSGTKTSGFQLLQGSNITFKNGTLKATAPTAQLLIQNYSNLTLEDVNLDGTTLSGWAYALSNNCGTINLTGSTSITAKTGGRAFDTCKYASYAIPTVNINTTGAISGPIEATGGKLNIENGKFDVTWVTDANYTAGDIQITGGVFSAEPAEEYCADGYVTTDNEDAETKDAYPYAVMSKEDAGIFELIDGEIYPYLHYTEDKVAASVTYKRNFTNKNWQALFVPFDINDVAKLTDKYEFAKVHMVALENDGTFTTGNKIEIYYTRVTSGKLSANQPYLIKLKNEAEQGWQDIVVENTILKDTHNMTPRKTSTMAADYYFTGTYEGYVGEKYHDFMAMGSGTINWGNTGHKLGTYRWYIKTVPFNDDYAKTTISFIEADEDATSISAANADENTEIEGYYSVNGVRSDVPVKGMNIVKYKNGKTKKIMIK